MVAESERELAHARALARIVLEQERGLREKLALIAAAALRLGLLPPKASPQRDECLRLLADAARASHQLVALGNFAPEHDASRAAILARAGERVAERAQESLLGAGESALSLAQRRELTALANELAETHTLLTGRVERVVEAARALGLGTQPEEEDAQELIEVASGRRLLLIEDDPVVVALMIEALQGRGWDITVARDGESALEIELDSFHVAVIDIDLPGRDGYSLLSAWRARGVGESTVKIVLSARSREGERARSIALGARAHLAKPLVARELLELIDAVGGNE